MKHKLEIGSNRKKVRKQNKKNKEEGDKYKESRNAIHK